MDKGSTYNLSQKQLKEELAFKLISGEKLSNIDKQDIYFLLTGKERILKSKGRPSTKVRDYHIALKFLILTSEGKRKSHNVREELKKQWWPEPIEDNTFYTALKRGMKAIQTRAEMWLDELDNNETLDMSEVEKNSEKLRFKRHLELLSDYRRKNKHLIK